MTFTFGTLCSGIDAAAVGFADVGADQRFAAEIDAFCCAVLATRHGATFPTHLPADYKPGDLGRLRRFQGWGTRLPNLGDIYQIDPRDLAAVDLLVSGTPCQDFSQAGTRKGLAGAHGQLTLRFLEIVNDLVSAGRLRAVLWENVPRVLTARGNPFGTILGSLLGSDAPVDNPWFGGKWPRAGVAVGPQGAAAWRVLDAQYSGLAQRRERLFLVAGLGPARVDPVAVLFERRGLSQAHPRRDDGAEAHASDLLEGCWPPVAYTLRTRETGVTAEVEKHDIFPTIRASVGGSSRPFVITPNGVRRMTPTEAERVFGFPPGYTAISWPPKGPRNLHDDLSTVGYGPLRGLAQGAPPERRGATDGPRFRAVGNSKPVPILRDLGRAFAREFSRPVSGDSVNVFGPTERTHA
jgi:site-specific DNA-cytosine methylase